MEPSAPMGASAPSAGSELGAGPLGPQSLQTTTMSWARGAGCEACAVSWSRGAGRETRETSSSSCRRTRTTWRASWW
eukprot:2987274-Heterocapsa_arctica.AAC.1